MDFIFITTGHTNQLPDDLENLDTWYSAHREYDLGFNYAFHDPVYIPVLVFCVSDAREPHVAKEMVVVT
jgi:hypothetical protein